MNIKLLSILTLVTVLSISFTSCNLFSDTAAKVDGDKITIDELNRYYYIQNKMVTNIESKEEIDKLAANPAYANHPFLNKANFLDHIIAQKLLYKKAMDDKNIDKEELDTLVEMVEMQTVAQYFLGKKLKDKITVTDEEVAKVYNENRAKFAGRTADEATNYIKQQIFASKSRQETNRYISDLVSESAINKDGFKEYMEKQKKNAPAVSEQQPATTDTTAKTADK